MTRQSLAGIRVAAGMALSVAVMSACAHHAHQHVVAARVAPVDSTPAAAPAAPPAAAPAAEVAATPAPAPAAPAPSTFAHSLALTKERGSRSQVRKGEHAAAPYIDRDGGPKNAGMILGSSEISGIQAIAPREPYMLHEVLYIRMPKGVTPTVGMRLSTVELGPEFESRGQVMVPSGELVVVAAGGDAEATSAEIVQQFGEIEPDHLVVPLETPAYPPVGDRAVAAPDGVKGSVLWVSSNPVLPSLGYYVVLTPTEADGVRLGDQFSIIRPRMRNEATGLWLPEQDIATTQVVRVGPKSVTAVVIAQTMPAIMAGDAVRLTARMAAR